MNNCLTVWFFLHHWLSFKADIKLFKPNIQVSTKDCFTFLLEIYQTRFMIKILRRLIGSYDILSILSLNSNCRSLACFWLQNINSISPQGRHKKPEWLQSADPDIYRYLKIKLSDGLSPGLYWCPCRYWWRWGWWGC